MEIANIVIYLKSVFSSLSHYYSKCDNWYDAKTLYNYYGKYCAAMTIAHKTKSRISKVFKKYGKELTIIDGENRTLAKWGQIKITSFKSRSNISVPYRNIEQLLLLNLKYGRKSLIKWNCVICGNSDNVEMHHIRHVRRSLEKKKGLNRFLEAMRLVNRKTIPLCKIHHLKVHNGQYDGKDLKKLFEYFQRNKVGFKADKAKALSEDN